MQEDDFTKLFKYMEKRFSELEEKVDGTATKQEINNLIKTVDAYAKKVDDYTQEMLMLAHKVDRMERWINQIAAKTGVQLDY